MYKVNDEQLVSFGPTKHIGKSNHTKPQISTGWCETYHCLWPCIYIQSTFTSS